MKRAGDGSYQCDSFKKTSIKDIAKEAGVTISTVSHVLNGSKHVTPPTAEKVRKAVKKLGYRPNRIARSLRTQSTEAIGVIVPDIKNPFYAIIIQEMERVARQRGYTLILGCTFYNLEEEKQQMQVLMDQFIDGLIFFGGYDCVEHLQYVRERNVPVVSVDREIDDPSIPAVLVDNIRATEQVVDHLAAMGHREIGYISFSYEYQTVVRHRYEGFRKGLEKHGLEYNPDYMIIDDATKLQETSGTYEIAKKWFAEKPLPTAFVTMSDLFAYGLISALRDLGYTVPRDVSVTGFCDNRMGDFFEPKVTTIMQPMEKMGRSSMNMLLDMVEQREPLETRLFFQAELLERDSVAPPRDLIAGAKKLEKTKNDPIGHGRRPAKEKV